MEKGKRMKNKSLFLTILMCLSFKTFSSTFIEENKMNEIIMIHNVPSLCYLVYSTDEGIKIRKEDIDGNGEYLPLLEEYPDIKLKSSLYRNENSGFETINFLGVSNGKNYFYSLIFYFAKDEPLLTVIPVDEDFNYVKTFVYDLETSEVFYIKEKQLNSYKIDLEKGIYEQKSCSLKNHVDKIYLYKDRWENFYYGIGEADENDNITNFAFSFDEHGFCSIPLVGDEIIAIKDFTKNNKNELCVIRKTEVAFFDYCEDLNIEEQSLSVNELGFDTNFLFDVMKEDNEFIFITKNENVIGNTSLILQNENKNYSVIKNNDLILEGNVFVKGDLQKGGLKDFIFVRRVYEENEAVNELYLYNFDSHCFVKRLSKNFDNGRKNDNEDDFEIIYTYSVDENKKSMFGLYKDHSCVDLFGEKYLKPEIKQFSKILNQISFILLQNETEYTVINKRR